MGSAGKRKGKRRCWWCGALPAEGLEHELLVGLDAGLVEGVDAQELGGEVAGEHEEVEEPSQVLLVHAVDLDGGAGERLRVRDMLRYTKSTATEMTVTADGQLTEAEVQA